MVETVLVILLVLWAMGFVTGTTMGGAVHILLVFAVVILVMRLVQWRRTPPSGTP